MAGERRTARVLAMKALYQADVRGAAAAGDARAFLEAEGGAAGVLAYARRLFEGVVGNDAEIARRLGAASRNWSLDRMSAVDRSILRIAAYEILFEPDVPRSVALDEAVAIAKEYGGEDSGRFVNGVLGGMAQG